MQVQDSEIAVVAFPIRSPGLQPDSMNWEQLDRFYDLSAGAPERVRLRDLTNWIIHSYVFVPEVRSDHAGSSTLTGFYCNSDRLRADRLLRVAWPDFRTAMQAVAHDDIVDMVTVRDG